MIAAMHPGFLADIIAHPDADDLRLIYADWLEDHGDPERAEFIRAQVGYEIALAEWGEPRSKPAATMTETQRLLHKRLGDLYDRAAELFARNGDGWLHAIAGAFGQDVVLSCVTIDPADVSNFAACVRVRRGFVSEIYCPCAAWRDHGPALVAAHPVEVVRLGDVQVREGLAGYSTTHLDGPSAKWPWNAEAFGGVPATWYDSEAECAAAISRACLLWARAEAVGRKLGVWAAGG